jgi:hypothetical protein
MRDDKIFSTCFSNNSWVGFVMVMLVPIFLNIFKYVSRTCEFLQNLDLLKVSVIIKASQNNVDNSINPASLKYFINNLCRDNLLCLVSKLQHYHGSTCRKISCNSSKVERSNRVYKSFKRSIFYTVPHIEKI